jgi:predicted Zn-dependent peptidase
MKKIYILLVSAILPSALNAKIYLDYEPDPLPVIKLNIVVPSTRQTKGDVENLGLRFLEEFYESGTKRLSRQKFQDVLASYGASIEINTGYKYAEISATFPLNKGQLPAGFGDLIREDWETPRINKEGFDRTKKHLKANHLALLDRDSTLLNLGLQKYMATSLFGLSPYSTATYDKISLADVEELQKAYYKKSDVWAGIIGPVEVKAQIAQLLTQIFPAAGEIKEGVMKEKLPTGFQPEQVGAIKPTFILIDKKDLAQIHYGFFRVSQKKEAAATELNDMFTYYVLAGAGVDSVFGKLIRRDRGIAYDVSGMMSDYYDHPIVSLYANPQKNKQEEAFSVLDSLIKDTFTDGKIIKSLSDNLWVGWLLSFRNGERHSGATPNGRLDKRKSIVKGELSFELYNTPVDEWTVKKNASASRLADIADHSYMIAGAVGDADDLKPMIKKYFPTYDLVTISYKDVINDNWLKKK